MKHLACLEKNKRDGENKTREKYRGHLWKWFPQGTSLCMIAPTLLFTQLMGSQCSVFPPPLLMVSTSVSVPVEHISDRSDLPEFIFICLICLLNNHPLMFSFIRPDKFV